MDDLIGCLFISLAGRDKDAVCAVVGTVDENHVLIADGKLRKVEAPKKKKLKHLKPIELPAGMSRLTTDRLTNRFIREAVAELLGENREV